jgi:hypothetical protein
MFYKNNSTNFDLHFYEICQKSPDTIFNYFNLIFCLTLLNLMIYVNMSSIKILSD